MLQNMLIVDNSLCSIDFSEKATQKSVRGYIASLFQSGVDYAEIDRRAMSFLGDVNTGEKFIFRIEGIEDFEIITQKRFKYLVLPLNMIAVAKKLSSLKIMLEVECGGLEFDELCDIRDKAMDAGCAAIRLISDFGENDKIIEDFIEWNDNFGCFPINICPLNTSLCGIDAALTAYWTDAGMLTLGFGSPYLYTPYESYFLYNSWSSQIFTNVKYIPYLFAAATYFNSISDGHNYALDNLTTIIDDRKKIVGNIDSGEMNGNIPRPSALNPNNRLNGFTKAQNSFFNRNDIFVRELCSSIADAVDNTDLALYDRFNESKELKQ